jgi:hypothetical protein
MAVLKKTLFPENLEKYSVLIQDTDPNSRYFKITELSDTFTGGKNAFLIQGSEFLVPDTIIKIEIKDSQGNIIYHEPGEGMVVSIVNGEEIVTEYYEGTSKVIAVYIYPDTTFGPCTITILGEISEYIDANGITQPIPLQYKDTYNVRWQTQVNVNPKLQNTTKIRFYKRPVADIVETIQPIYQIISGSKVETGINQSFANVKISNLETFAGDVKRVKVFRTSEGDISDFDLIQDILVESKELLTTFDLTSSVVGRTGIFSGEVLSNFWDTGSLYAELNSLRVESGLKITGSGILKHLPLLDLSAGNTYEFGIDAFYSGSEVGNLSVFIASGSNTSSVLTLNGISPVRNLLDTTFQFELDKTYPSGTLYFSQSAGEWHIGDISLRLTQDTAFSPDEITFITTMPTVVGNEIYDFKFEFYDVNNNYVPIFVTQSALFTGGTTLGTLVNTLSSSSVEFSESLAAVSQSISGTITFNSASTETTITFVSSSTNTTINSVSSSISSSIITLSGSVSGTIDSVSSSVNTTINLVSGSVSGSIYSLSGSVSTSLSLLSSSIAEGGVSQSQFLVLSASAYLEQFIFTDKDGRLRRPPTASAAGLYTGDDHLGFYSESVWKTYMDDQGDFYLTGSAEGGGFLAWSSAQSRLQIQGDINIQGGNAATNDSVTAAINSATSSLSSSLSSSLGPRIFTTATGLIANPPGVLVDSQSGLYLGNSFLGYYDGNDWRTYMANNGNFFLSGMGGDSLAWVGGVLTINGAINITGGNAATTTQVNTAAANAVQSGSLAAQTEAAAAQAAAINQAKSDASASINLLANGNWTGGTGTFITANSISSPIIVGNGGYISGIFVVGDGGAITLDGINKKIYIGTGTHNNPNTAFYVDNVGQMSLKDKLVWDGNNLSIQGSITVTGGDAATQTYANNVGANAVLSGSISAQTEAASAQAAAELFAQNAANRAVASGSISASVAQTNATNNALAFASGAVNLLANGGWTNPGTTFISANSISSPIIAGNAGYISSIFKVGENGITLDGPNQKIFVGAGTHANSNTPFYVDNANRFSLGDKVTWNGTTLSIDGDITARSGFIGSGSSGFTINNTFIANGKTSISDANAGVYVGTNGISLGANNAFVVSSLGELSATAANISGSVNATGGRIGQWIIDGPILRDVQSRIQLNPNTPAIDILDTSNIKRLTMKFGALTSPFSTANISIDPPAFSMSTRFVFSGFETIESSTSSSVFISDAGTYTGTYTYGTSQVATSNGNWSGDFFVKKGILIKDTNNNTIVTINAEGVGLSDPQTTIDFPAGSQTVSFTIPAAGLYNVYSFIEYEAEAGDDPNPNGRVFVDADFDDSAFTANILLDIAEISNDGFQVISSADNYCTIQRGGFYAIDAKGSLNITTPNINTFIYLRGVVHPGTGNTYDLGTTDNRWKTIFLNNAPDVGSDIRLKNDIIETDLGLDFINSLNPVKYKINDAKSPRYHYGLIAQEVTSSLLEYGITTNDVGFINSASINYTAEEIEDFKTKPNWESIECEISASLNQNLSLRYEEFISPMIKAIQELTAKVQELELKISGSL